MCGQAGIACDLMAGVVVAELVVVDDGKSGSYHSAVVLGANLPQRKGFQHGAVFFLRPAATQAAGIGLVHDALDVFEIVEAKIARRQVMIERLVTVIVLARHLC